MKTSGTTGIGTNSDAAVPLIAASGSYANVLIQNYGTVPGFFSVDGGANWTPLPAGNSSNPGGFAGQMQVNNLAVQIKRFAGGPDLFNVYATIWN